MRKSGPNETVFSPNGGKLSPESAARAAAFLRQAHPSKTPEFVETRTGGLVSAGAVKKWLAGAGSPSFIACMALIVAYGPEFLAAVLDDPPGWLSAAARQERQRALEAEQARIAREIEDLSRTRLR